MLNFALNTVTTNNSVLKVRTYISDDKICLTLYTIIINNHFITHPLYLTYKSRRIIISTGLGIAKSCDNGSKSVVYEVIIHKYNTKLTINCIHFIFMLVPHRDELCISIILFPIHNTHFVITKRK